VIVSSEERCDTCKVHLTSPWYRCSSTPEIVVVQHLRFEYDFKENVCIDLDRHINFRVRHTRLKRSGSHGCRGYPVLHTARGERRYLVESNDSSCTECMDPSIKVQPDVDYSAWQELKPRILCRNIMSLSDTFALMQKTLLRTRRIYRV
jgi:hypothetical protein